MPKAKKRKTSSTSRKAVSRKSIAVQKKVVKKDKGKLALQILLGIAAALLLIFIISKFSANVTGNVPAVDADPVEGDSGSFIIESLGDSADWVRLFLGDLSAEKGFDSGQVLLVKVMFLLLISLGFWAMIGRLSILKSEGQTTVNPFLRAFLTFALGVLFTRWLTNNASILSVLTSYSAVGMTLSALLPLIVIYYILTFEIKGDDAAPIRIFGWILFFGYLIFQTVIAFQAVQTDPLFSGGIKGNLDIVLVYPICMMITIILILLSPRLRTMMLIKTAGMVSKTWYDSKLAEFAQREEMITNTNSIPFATRSSLLSAIAKEKQAFAKRYASRVAA